MEAFYLKYRPQNLDDLIGQDLVKKTLLSAFQTNKLSHAYLFVGPRGTGKTSTARILAKMINCEGKQSLRSDDLKGESVKLASRSEGKVPCNICSTCISITDGSNLDLIEIDAASNRGIDDIRSLREKIKLAPSGSKKKVYIIDEVHMLTTEAFNALLKTLEEPPAHALFILATTDVSKLPQTIISRVQKLDFKLATQDELGKALEKIIKMEKIDITEEALQILKTAAQGSFRDAIKILDQASGMGKKIDADEMIRMLHGTSMPQVLNLLEHLANHDSKSALLLLSDLEKYGVDFKVLAGAVMEIMRALMLIKNDLGLNLVQPEYGSEQYPSLVVLAEKFTITDLSKFLDIFQSALEKLKFTSIPSLPLELAVVEICGESESAKTSVIAIPHRLMQEKQSKSDSSPALLSLEEEPTKIASPSDKGPASSPRNDDNEKPISSELTISSDSADILKLKEKWTFVLETIRPFNFSLEALLRSVNITQCTETTLIIEVPYSFHQRILESPKNREILEGILSEILGRQIKISAILRTRPQRVEDLANIEVAKDDEIIRAAAEIFSSDSIN